MDKLFISEILKSYFIIKPIGFGTTAICFYTAKNNVIKLYYHKSFGAGIQERLYSLSQIFNDTFITPDELILDKNLCVGYIYPYISGSVIRKIPYSVNLSDYQNTYHTLVEDTKKISEYHFQLSDLHDKNILFNGSFKVIDLDRGNFKQDLSVDDIFKKNILKLNQVIMDSIFLIRDGEILLFYDYDLQKIYETAAYDDYQAIMEFFDRIKFIAKKDIPVQKIKHIVRYDKDYNSYFKF